MKKRKRRTGLSCDRHCESCKNPCDNPVNPVTFFSGEKKVTKEKPT